MPDNPLWYKDAVIYEVHVRAFQDSNGDGIGDFAGLSARLDYLADLGINAIWLLPFYPSPLRDDGYDIANYQDVHPAYGTLDDFRRFLDAAHERGIRVITELVINHTSSDHPWFQRARRAPPGHPDRDFYVWSDTPEPFAEARIIFKDFETSNWAWDAVAKSYYWHRFYSHQPDLNYRNPAVHAAIFEVLDFWMAMGVDGLRLDAVPYLFEREGTNCENLPETHAFLKRVRKHIDERWPNRMLLAEANQWPEDAAAYFGDGDECHMNFHFPLMPRMFMAVQLENRFPVVDILAQTPSIPETSQWAIFLRNHDELTLEMVTDEDRDYMYRVYASDPQARINLGIRRRLAPLLESRRRVEMMDALLFSMPGTPVVYYGDEIGMGDNIYLGDRNGVRTPMQWSADRNAGFSQANPQRLYLPVIIDPSYHYEAINVEVQQNSPSSLLWYTKRLIALRKRYRAFGRGTMHVLAPENTRVLAFTRRYEDEVILVLANLSRFVQSVQLDLCACAGRVPVELFGKHALPAVGPEPYLFTLPPHGFYWFALEPPMPPRPSVAPENRRAVLEVRGPWTDVLAGKAREKLEAILPDYLWDRRWFQAPTHRVTGATITEEIAIPGSGGEVRVLFVRIEYPDRDPETYVLPLGWITGAAAAELEAANPDAVVARLRAAEGEGILIDALHDPSFTLQLRAGIAAERRWPGQAGELVASVSQTFDPDAPAPGAPVVLVREQANTSIAFGEGQVLKVFRGLHEGINPDLEIGRYLTETAGFPHAVPVIGALEHRVRGREPTTVGLLTAFVPNQGDAWLYTLDALGRYYDRVLARKVDAVALPPRRIVDRLGATVPPETQETIGPYLAVVQLLGQRIAQLHGVLARPSEDPHFRPEPFSQLYQRSLYQAARARLAQAMGQLRVHRGTIAPAEQPKVDAVLEAEGEIDRQLRGIAATRIVTDRIRVHGNLDLGKVLFTGKDFVFIDFEGEPARPISERRFKRSALRDVTSMIRSFHFAADLAVRSGHVRDEDVAPLARHARVWERWVGAAFLQAYLEAAGHAAFLPETRADLGVLLDFYVLDKLLYEIGWALDHRPDWLGIPLYGVLSAIGKEGEP